MSRHRRTGDDSALLQLEAALRGLAPPTRSAAQTYTATTTGTSPIVDLLSTFGRPMDRFSMSVKGTGAAATAWDVWLQFSADGVNFTNMLRHVNGTNADGDSVSTRDILYPTVAMRVNVVGLTLGGPPPTNIVVTALPMP